MNDMEVTLWSLVSPNGFVFYSWEDEDFAVVYNKISGDTHLVDFLSLTLLKLLADGSCSYGLLTTRLLELFPDEKIEALSEFVGNALIRLLDMDLVKEINA
jgi:PqqD family protein of HPr-rel-A system